MNQYDDIYDFEDKPKRKRDEDPTTWADAWKAISIFAAVSLIISIVMTVIRSLFFEETYQKYIDITINANSTQAYSEIFVGYMRGIQTPLGLVLTLIVSLILTIVAVLILYGLTHTFASNAQSGDGTLRGLIVRGNWWTIGIYIVYSILTGIVSFVMMSSIVDRFVGVTLTQSTSTFNEYGWYIMSLLFLTVSISLITWLIWSFAMSFVAAKNYHFSKKKGCLTLVLTNFAILGLYCGCAFALGFSAGFVGAAFGTT